MSLPALFSNPASWAVGIFLRYNTCEDTYFDPTDYPPTWYISQPSGSECLLNHLTGSFKMDISINAIDGPRLTPIVRDHLKAMPTLRYLVLALKAFLSARGLNSAATGGLSSYGIICLVISFLQHNPTKRPVQYLEHPMQAESLGHLLIDLFGYYASTVPYAS